MIIELFGPPGVGKTTFARALTTRLRESGHNVHLMLSYRPAESGSAPILWPSRPAGRRVAAAVRRLSRPFLEVVSILGHPFLLQDIEIATDLLKILPPRNRAIAIRLGQYILRLSHSWYHASSTGSIVVFDQAFTQLVCSLVLHSKYTDKSLIAKAVDIAPRSDLAIRLEAPTDVLAARLKDRKCKQGVFEQLLELDLNTNLKSMEIIDQLHRLMIERGQLIVCTSSLDRQSLNETIKATEVILAARFGAALHSPAEQGLRAGNLAGKAVI
jgi:thymidylate kinase